MKTCKKLIANFFLFFFIAHAYAQQDTIYFLNNSKTAAQVISVSGVEGVSFTKDSTGKRVINVPKNTVRLIVYKNGSVNIVSVKHIDPAAIQNYPMYLKGMNDADIYYKNPGGAIATGILSFLTGGIAGLLTAIPCSATKPKFANLGLPNNAPVTNKDYMLGYVSRAKKIKQRRVWTGYGVGVAGAVALALVINH